MAMELAGAGLSTEELAVPAPNSTRKCDKLIPGCPDVTRSGMHPTPAYEREFRDSKFQGQFTEFRQL